MKKIFLYYYRKVKKWIYHNTWVMAVAAGIILVSVVSVTIVSCSAEKFTGYLDEAALSLDDSYWKTEENGRKYYDKTGYITTTGIDVSEWVQEIDFKEVKKSGIDFVILRVGYRGYVSGGFVLDNNLTTYLKNASKAGLKIGLYFVSQAVNEEEAIEEAEYVMKQAKGYKIEMPIYIDLEPVYDEARTDGLTKNDYTKIALAFCKCIEESGYRAGIYANETWYLDNLDFSKIKNYDIWLAKYTESPSTDLAINMWQYSCEGDVEGSALWVDLNARVSLEKYDN